QPSSPIFQRRALSPGRGMAAGGSVRVPRRCAYSWGVRSARPEEGRRGRPEERAYEIPGLEPVTSAGRMHHVPGLARPRFPRWEPDAPDPRFYRAPPPHRMPLHRPRPCFFFQQRCRLLEGVKQALWLTKAKLVEGLPERLLRLAADPSSHVPDQDERVQRAIFHARLWLTTDAIPTRENYCPAIMENLLQLCRSLMPRFPSLSRRILARNYTISAVWHRDSTVLQIRGLNGTRLSSLDVLPPVASHDQIQATAAHTLEDLYPLAPTINLEERYVYQLKDDTGFEPGYLYQHPHTIYFLESANWSKARMKPEQLRAKMIMFAFGNALARARALHGEEARVLEQPIVVQAVGTDGRLFQFLVFQLNTTDLTPSTGIKNLVWMDGDQLLYQHFRCYPKIHKREVVEPSGLIDYQPDTFRKFLALFLHGAKELEPGGIPPSHP
uniref:Large ribosomal subunit protein mL37 n=2 Tax=Ornithorhynchus anatinus TaxID=9258 RepID=F7F901_ORNAN